jgi:hypothetical protein
MKKGLLIAALFIFGTGAAFAQNAPAAATEKTVKTTKSKKSKKSKPAAASSTAVMYECPMKCEPATAKAGKCGKCGMDLKAKKA